MKKILIINTVGLKTEGITAVIKNFAIHMDRSDIQLEFIGYEWIDPGIKEQFEALGTVHVLPDRRTNTLAYSCSLFNLLRKGYDVFHIHGNSGTMLLEVMCARFAGIPQIITHGHSTASNHILIHKLLRQPMSMLATDTLACSQAAGAWLYGNHDFTVLNNAIDTKLFQFDSKVRNEIRKTFGLEGKFVLGHVGRFTEEKNQLFLIDILSAMHRQYPNILLFLIGFGPMEAELKEKVRSLELENSVIFAGKQLSTEKMYQAMDLFVFPSKREGAPVTAIEAQANGLFILASDVIPPTVFCTDSVTCLSLSSGVDTWVREVISVYERGYDRTKDVFPALQSHGFDIWSESERLHSLYSSGAMP